MFSFEHSKLNITRLSPYGNVGMDHLLSRETDV